MRFHLTDSQIEARRALQCFLAHIGRFGHVFRDERYSPGEISDGKAGFLKTVAFRDEPQDGFRVVRILLHKNKITWRWDPSRVGWPQWRAERLQYWPNREDSLVWDEYELNLVWGDGGFKYKLTPVKPVKNRNSRPIEAET